jgi:SNF2 family DNA or RNA helicase
MNDSSCKVLLGSITSMGVGLTLTAANTVIFLDSPWTKTDKTQAEDRTHRIGTNGTVNIITLVCSGTIDERVEQIVESKGELSDFIVDGQINPKNKVNMLRYLLS